MHMIILASKKLKIVCRKLKSHTTLWLLLRGIQRSTFSFFINKMGHTVEYEQEREKTKRIKKSHLLSAGLSLQPNGLICGFLSGRFLLNIKICFKYFVMLFCCINIYFNIYFKTLSVYYLPVRMVRLRSTVKLK
jgi:hypothetical protein